MTYSVSAAVGVPVWILHEILQLPAEPGPAWEDTGILLTSHPWPWIRRP